MKVIHESGPYNVVHDQYQYSILPIDVSNSKDLSGSYEYIISAVNKNGVVGMGNGIVCFYTYSSLSAKAPEVFCSSDCLFPMQFDGTNFNYALPSGELVSCQ